MALGLTMGLPWVYHIQIRELSLTTCQAAGGAWRSDAAEVRGTDSQLLAVDIAMVGVSIVMGGHPNGRFMLENPNLKLKVPLF